MAVSVKITLFCDITPYSMGLQPMTCQVLLCGLRIHL